MAKPIHLFVKMLRLEGISLSKLRQTNKLPNMSFTDQHYVMIQIGNWESSRSKPLSLFSDSYDFTADPGEWTSETLLDLDQDVEIIVQIWCDRGDEAPVLLWEMIDSISPPNLLGTAYKAGYLTADGMTLRLEAFASLRSAAKQVAIDAARMVPNSLHGTLNTISQWWYLTAELTEIRGLYRPYFLGSDDHFLATVYEQGYSSQDNEGRIFINRDLDGKWTKNRQIIELTVEIRAFNGPIPAGAKVEWAVYLCNDSSDDPEFIHREAAPILDPSAHSNGVFTGAVAAAEGTWPSPPWEAIQGYTLTQGQVPSKTNTAVVVALTDSTVGTSKVRLHCPDTGGDRFRVVVNIVPNDQRPRWLGIRTGIMTMWKRIQVQSVRMASAYSLPTHIIGRHFERAYVQMEFTSTQVVADQDPLANSRNNLDQALTTFIDKVFTHKGDPGWFCLIAAMSPFPTNTSTPRAKLHTGQGSLDQHGMALTFNTPSDWSEQKQTAIGSVALSFDTQPQHHLSFPVLSAERINNGAQVKLRLRPHDITPEFPGADNDGSIAAAYAQMRNYFGLCRIMPNQSSGLVGGYKHLPQQVDITLYGRSATFQLGISPTVPIGSNDSAFAGRTVLWTHARSLTKPVTGSTTGAREPRPDFADKVLGTIVHELTHAFGLPHKCGHWNYFTPREQSCCMNYNSHGLLMADGVHLDARSGNKLGPTLCAQHAKAIRRIHLEDNRGLKWS